jgi:hypothetical protein
MMMGSRVCTKLTNTVARAATSLETVGKLLASAEVDEVGAITGTC